LKYKSASPEREELAYNNQFETGLQGVAHTPVPICS
jgi:hypothetical protein